MMRVNQQGVNGGARRTPLMPEGLLDTMNEQQVKDLFAYFMAGGPAGKK